MGTQLRRNLCVAAPANNVAEIDHAIWKLDDTRQRTLTLLAELPAGSLDWVPPINTNTVGTLLYHIALIEADWLFAEVLEKTALPPALAALFPVDDRDQAGQLSVVSGLSLDDHLARLAAVRDTVHAVFRAMPLDDFYRVRHLPDYDVTPEWVLHHLMQHEAEHRGQIGVIRDLYELILARR